MKKLIVVLVLVSGSAFGQKNHFNPVTDTPVDMQVDDSHVYVQGNWVALDERSKLAGISTSEITCERVEKTCREVQANLVFVGDQFTLTPDSLDYTIVRWDRKEIVAQNVSGLCKVLNSLKFDLENRKVYYLRSLSEPVEGLPKISRDACNAVGMRLELHDKTMYWTGPTVK